ncbi:hypothetical protein SEA_BRUHMOMENT_88 [Arthrobacter phage BruhMoment]|nr:hypothetical protein SEA_BRUHMOMENT_88 [Arthrobacter phage BruhMoment]
MSETTKRIDGPRNATLILREVATLMERNPGMKFPSISFGSYGDDTVRFHVHHYPDWRTPQDQRERETLLKIETTFATVMEHFDAAFGDLEWVANDPSDDTNGMNKNYFILTAEVRGALIQLLCNRSDVGETVDVMHSGPQVIEENGYVQAVRQTATIWKPNISLGRRATAREWELESKPVVLALTEAEPF